MFFVREDILRKRDALPGRMPDVDGHNAGCEVKDGVLYVAAKLGIETIKCHGGELFAWCGQTRRNAKSGRFESALVRCKAPGGVR